MACLFAFLYPFPAISVYFEDVVDYGHQLPLAVHFDFSAQAEAFYAEGGVDVAKHRFDDAQAFAIVMPTFGAVNLLFHFFDKAGLVVTGNAEVDVHHSGTLLVCIPQTLSA